MHSMSRRRFGALCLITTTVLVLAATAAVSAPGDNSDEVRTVAAVEFLGEVIVETGSMFAGTEIGGLSSITYDRLRDVYYIISDDQGNREDSDDPVRYYTASIDVSDGSFGEGDVTFTDVTAMSDVSNKPVAPGGLDPEGLVLGMPNQLFFSSEGNIFADPIIDPFIRRYNRQGKVTAHLPIPDHYIPNGVDHGVRFNLGFESLNLTPNREYLVTAGEAALFQDGPAASFTNGSLARILAYDLNRRTPVAEYVYEVASWAEPSGIFGVNGIVEVLPIDNAGTMLVMERSFSVGGVLGGGTGNVVAIYEVSTRGATDVLDIDALYDGGSPITFDAVDKSLVFHFDDLGIPIDNIEGMTFGPDLPDGRRSLVIVSDNNFSAGQFTQFVVLALDVEAVG